MDPLLVDDGDDDDYDYGDNDGEGTVVSEPGQSFRKNHGLKHGLPCYVCGRVLNPDDESTVRFTLPQAPRHDTQAVFAVRHRTCRNHFVMQ